MPEQRSILYTPWTQEPGAFDICINCKMPDKAHSGVMLRRRVTGRDGESHVEYKIECPNCGYETDIHRQKLITAKEWTAKQIPKDNLPYRNRKRPTH